MVDYTTTPNYKFIKPNVGQARDKWGDHLNSNIDDYDHLFTIGQKKVLTWIFPTVSYGFPFTWNVFGQLHEHTTAAAVDSGSPLALSTGNCRVQVDVNAGTTLTGTLVITGTSRHSVTGALTVGDTENLAIDGAGSYVSAKFWTGSFTLSTTDLDISDLDVGDIMWYDNNGRRFAVQAISTQCSTHYPGATVVTTLYKAVKTGSGLTLTELTSGLLDLTDPDGVHKNWAMDLEIPSLDVSGRDEGIICQVATSGAPGAGTRNLRVDLHYENRPTS